jgi:hypothetical protein
VLYPMAHSVEFDRRNETGKAVPQLVHRERIKFLQAICRPPMKKDGCVIFAPLKAADR